MTAAPTSASLPRISRDDFLADLGEQLQPGDHVTLLGPTGRGKSTVMGDLIPHLTNFDTVAVLAPKGRDPAYAELGHPTEVWPPRRTRGETFRVMFGRTPARHEDDGAKVWRVEVPIRKTEDFLRLRGLYGSVLRSTLARKEGQRDRLLIVVDDTRFVSDPKAMGLAPLVTQNLILARSKNVSIINNVQAPRWVPRETLDQVSHVLVFRNRDRDVAKRLTEISGAIDPRTVEAAIAGLSYHDFLWVDGRNDRISYVVA